MTMMFLEFNKFETLVHWKIINPFLQMNGKTLKEAEKLY